MKSWKTLARKRVIEFGKWLTIENHTVQLHDGRVIENWPYIVTPDYVNVLVETEDGAFLCFRQTKYSVEGKSLAPVSGYLEPGEEPLVAAQRELLEETGYKAPEWISLGHYSVDGNRGAGVANLFLARGARRIKEANADDLEEQQMLRLSRSEIEAALAAGEFKVLAWQAVVALGLLHLNGLTKSKEGKMPEIKRFPKMRVAYVTEVGSYGDASQRGFGKVFAWLDANKVQPLGAPIGIFYDDPTKVAPEKMRSDLCVPVAPNVQGSGGVNVKEIGDFEAATIMYQGEQNITRAYNEVYDWLYAQGYHDAGAPMETYFSQPPEELRAQVAVPIVKMTAPAPKKAAAKKPAKKLKKPMKKATKKVAKKSVKRAARKTANKTR